MANAVLLGSGLLIPDTNFGGKPVLRAILANLIPTQLSTFLIVICPSVFANRDSVRGLGLNLVGMLGSNALR